MTSLSLQPGATGIDTYIRSDVPNANNGATTGLSGIETPTIHRRSLIKFDLSSVPAGANISSASLILYAYSVGASPSASVYRSLVEWYEGDATGGAPSGDGSTWNHRNYNGSVAWSGGAGGASGTEWYATPTDTQTLADDSYITWDVTNDVQNFIDGVHENYGWWLIVNDAVYNNSFSSSDSGTADQRPELAIEYTFEDRSVSVQETVSVGESFIGEKIGTPNVEITEPVLVSDVPALFTDILYLVVQDSITAGEYSVPVIGQSFEIQDSVSISESLAFLIYEPNYGFVVQDTVSLTEAFWYRTNSPGPKRKYALPAFYLTDGQYENGKLRRFDFLNRFNGYSLCGWEPTIAQQKNGGNYTESALVSGRRLVSFAYENPIEVLNLQANALNQNKLIEYTRDLFSWLERAAEYWTSRWATHPIYLVARSAYEQETRYAVIYNASIPKLQNLYGDPFFNQQNSFFNDIEIYLERGHWLDSPPGESECVSLSTDFVWNWNQAQIVEASSASVGGGGIVTGSIHALIEADDGTVLAGSDDAAKVYGSSDDGRSWTLLDTIGSGADLINAFTKDGSGNIYAAVSGSSSVGGVWRSPDNGLSWTRVFGGTVSDTNGREIQDWQCFDVLFAPLTGYIHAVGWGFKEPEHLRAPTYADSQDGTTWATIISSRYYYKAVAIALDRGYWPNVLENFEPGGATGNAWIYYSATDHISMGFTGTWYGPYAYGGYDLVGYDSGLPAPSPWRLFAALKTPSAGTHTDLYRLYLSTSYFYAKVYQFSNDVVKALYVDPANTSPSQHLYAGGDGNVYKSIGGFSWSLISTVPTGAVYSFLRTDTTMLAGGDDGIILLEGGDLPGGTEPPAEEGVTVPAQVTVGQSDVCGEPGVYVGNQRFQSSLTNVLQYDNGTTAYTELYPMTIFPVELFPSVPEVDDAVYFGVQSDMAETNAGPFANLVFNLDPDQLGRDITITWEYWSGATWSTLTVKDGTVNFTADGNHAVTWQIAAANWTTTDVQSITGWWVRARVSAVATYPQSPRQLLENVFTSNNTYAEVDTGEIGGDIPALSHIIWQNAGDKDNGDNYPHGYIDRLLVGLRSYSRGAEFTSLVNISDQQAPFGFTLTAGSYSSWAASGLAMTGRALYTSLSITSFDDPTGAWQTLVTVDIDNTVAANYFGTFRVLARCYRTTGDADDWRLRLSTKFGSGGNVRYSKNYPYVATANAWHVVDFGSITLPTEQSVTENVGDTLQLIVQGWCSGAAIPLYLFDLILIPTDEWSVDVVRPSYSAGETDMRVSEDNYIDVNSLLTKASAVVGTNRAANSLIKSDYQVVTNGKGILQTNAKQRLWFFAMTQVGTADWVGYPHALGKVRLNRVQRYKAVRGVS